MKDVKFLFSICDKEESETNHVPENNRPNGIVIFVDQSKSILL